MQAAGDVAGAQQAWTKALELVNKQNQERAAKKQQVDRRAFEWQLAQSRKKEQANAWQRKEVESILRIVEAQRDRAMCNSMKERERREKDWTQATDLLKTVAISAQFM